MSAPTPMVHDNLRTPGKRRASGALQVRKRFAAAPGWDPSPNYSSRNGTTVTAAVIHTAEGPTDADSLGAYFAQVKVQVSSHAGADDSKRVNYVDPKYEAWTLRNGNPWTDNLEMCGFAAWTRAQWLAHPGMIGQAAQWVAERCHARNVPPVRLTADDIRAGRRSGYFAHWDYTLATGDGTHWDVGSGFPWDVFAGLVQAAYNGSPQEDDMDATQAAQLKAVYDERPKIDQMAWAILGDDKQPGIRAVLASILAQQAKQADPAALAAALAPLLVAALPQSPAAVSEADLETALRNVLGSLNDPK